MRSPVELFTERCQKSYAYHVERQGSRDVNIEQAEDPPVCPGKFSIITMEQKPRGTLVCRTELWPEDVSIVLVEEVHRRRDLIYGESRGCGRGTELTRAAWREIKEILDARGFIKEVAQISKRHSNIKQSAKRKLREQKSGERTPVFTPSEDLFIHLNKDTDDVATVSPANQNLDQTKRKLRELRPAGIVQAPIYTSSENIRIPLNKESSNVSVVSNGFDCTQAELHTLNLKRKNGTSLHLESQQLDLKYKQLKIKVAEADLQLKQLQIQKLQRELSAKEDTGTP